MSNPIEAIRAKIKAVAESGFLDRLDGLMDDLMIAHAHALAERQREFARGITGHSDVDIQVRDSLLLAAGDIDPARVATRTQRAAGYTATAAQIAAKRRFREPARAVCLCMHPRGRHDKSGGACQDCMCRTFRWLESDV